MTPIEFTAEQKDILVAKIETYFESELDQEIGQFEAEFLIDFISENMGGIYYNKGLQDAQLVVRSKLDDLEAEIESLEKITE